MRSLPLHDAHAARGAVFREAEGSLVPAHYGDAQGEALRAQREPVVTDRSCGGRIRVRGRDRVEFLHGIASSDVKALATGAGQATTFLTGKGKMRGDGVLYGLEDALLLACSGDALPGLLAHLESFVIMEDVRIEDRSAETAEILVHGPGARARLAQALECSVAALLARHHFVTIPFAGGEILAASESPAGAEGVLLFAEAPLAPALWSALVTRMAPSGYDAFEVLRVEAGIPRFGSDTDESTIPLEAHLEEALSSTKGCYSGNEVIARIRTYGHVNRSLAGLVLEGERVPCRRDRVLAGGKPVGEVTSAVFSPTLAAPIALAMLRREVAAVGGGVEVEHEGSRTGARVAALPFVRRDG